MKNIHTPLSYFKVRKQIVRYVVQIVATLLLFLSLSTFASPFTTPVFYLLPLPSHLQSAKLLIRTNMAMLM